MNGKKACVMLKVNPYFDIKLNKKKDHDKLSTQIINSLVAKDWNIASTEFVRSKQYMKYHIQKMAYLSGVNLENKHCFLKMI